MVGNCTCLSVAAHWTQSRGSIFLRLGLEEGKSSFSFQLPLLPIRVIREGDREKKNTSYESKLSSCRKRRKKKETQATFQLQVGALIDIILSGNGPPHQSPTVGILLFVVCSFLFL